MSDDWPPVAVPGSGLSARFDDHQDKPLPFTDEERDRALAEAEFFAREDERYEADDR